MYTPYLRGRQEELLAIRDFGETLPPTVLPIFKPTSANSRAAGRYSDIADAGIRFALILNSDDGQPPPSVEEVRSLIDGRLAEYPDEVMPALELRSGMPITILSEFVGVYADRERMIIHKAHTFGADQVVAALDGVTDLIHVFVTPGTPSALQTNVPASKRVLLRDGFELKPRNGDYPPQSSFDDLAWTYQELGFDGFGDFSTVGDRFAPGGGRANHVALHLTEPSDRALISNHFISTSAGPDGDNTSKYFEALRQMTSYTGIPARPPFDTAGAMNFIDTADPEHYPGLGCAKRWSIMHHTELMSRIIEPE
jgi:hypothetical protein